MRIRFILCCGALSLFLFTGCRSYKTKDPLAVNRSEHFFRDDFGFFREILESGHPSLYSYLSKKEVTRLFDSVYQTINSSLSLREFYQKLCFLSNRIGCSHTYLDLPASITDSLEERNYFFPYPVTLIGKRLLVNVDWGLAHGTEILSVDNKSAAAILQDLSMYNPVEGSAREAQQQMAAADFGFQYYLQYGKKQFFDVRIRDTLGRVTDTVFSAVTLSDLRTRESSLYYYDATDVPYTLRFMNEDVYAYMRFSTFDYNSGNKQAAYENFLKNSFDLLKTKSRCKYLIIDLRENTGGYLYSCFLLYSYLADSSFREYRQVSARMSKIPFRAYLSPDFLQEDVDKINDRLKNEFRSSGNEKYIYVDSLINVWNPDPVHFGKKVFIITNARVLSAAAYFCTLMQKTGRGKLVGVETAGGEHSGGGFQNLEYRLPRSGFHLIFPYARIVYTYSDSKTGRGLLPDYVVPDDDSSFMGNRDAQQFFITDSLNSK